MKKRWIMCLFFAVLVIGSVFGQSMFNSLLSLKIEPGINVPLGADSDLFKLNYGGKISGEISMPFFPVLYASVDVGYNFVPLRTDITDMSLMAFGGGIGLDLNPIPTVSVRAFGRGGYYYGFLHNGADSGGSPFVDLGLGTYILFSSKLGFGLDAGYRQNFGLGSELFVTAGMIINVIPSKKGFGTGGIMEPKPGEGLDLLKVDLDSIFPVFYSYYDDNPVGKAVIKNFEKKPISDIEISYFVKQYMDNPKTCSAPATLAPGETAEVDLYGLFTNKILEVSEGSKVSAQINVKYTYNKGSYRRERIVTMDVQNRNAITWDDDRRVAAFVTAKDTSILRFAKNTAGIVKKNASSAVNRNLVLAMGLNTALKEYGINYVIDPSTPYSELSGNASAVDFIQFPMQTLEYKAGDCDDLSVLNCALLEAVGVETAFITIPGHIFMAFSLGISEKEAERQFQKPEDLVFMEGKVWVPVEITELDGDFLKAWQTGAKEWRENAGKMKARFYPTHQAWEKYKPVGFDIARADITQPDEQKVTAAFVNEYSTFVDREIYPRVKELKAKIARSKSVRDMNKLGVLYARYGLNDRAEEQFKKIIAGKKYFPALLNLGNINYLSGDYSEALSFYNQAAGTKPNYPKVLLGIARTSHQMEQYETSTTAYNKLKSLDPALAEKFSYLDLKGEESTRASDIAQVKNVMVWEDEE